MPPQDSPSPNNADGHENDERDDRLRMSRRDVIVGTVAAGVATSVGSAPVMAGTETIDYGTAFWSNGDGFYFQFKDGEVDVFGLDKGTWMSLDFDPMQDDYIIGEIALKVDGGSYETFGSDKYNLTSTEKQGGGTVEFDADELWGNDDGTVQSDEHFDFQNITAVGTGYENIEVDVPSVGDPPGAPLAETHDYRVRFRFVSENGTVTEEEVLHFWMGTGVPLGFGQYFGANFGKDHVESWPSDWDT